MKKEKNQDILATPSEDTARLSCTTVKELLDAFLPEEFWSNAPNTILRKIKQFIFASTPKNDLLEEIKGSTNINFTVSLSNLRFLVKELGITNYRELDHFFVSQKAQLIPSSDLEDCIPPNNFAPDHYN